MQNKSFERRKKKIRKSVLAKIISLIQLAEHSFTLRPTLSNEYIKTARKLSMQHKVRIPSQIQKKFCKHCHTFLMPGNNCRVRIRNKTVMYFCQQCKKCMRFRTEPRKTKIQSGPS